MFTCSVHVMYSHLFSSRGGAKVPELIKEEVGINVEGGIFWKKLVHNCNKRGVEGGKKIYKSISVTPRLLER